MIKYLLSIIKLKIVPAALTKSYEYILKIKHICIRLYGQRSITGLFFKINLIPTYIKICTKILYNCYIL